MTKNFSLTGLVLATIVNIASSGELTIYEVVNSALSYHPKAEIALAGASEAEGNRLSELSITSPTIALEFEGIPEGSTLSDYEERRLSISQELDFPLHLLWNSSALNATVDQARLQSITQLLDLEMEVRFAYLDAWATQERAQILRENASHLETYASKTERMAELGESSVLEARSTRVEAIIAKNDFEVTKRKHSAFLANLQSLSGFELSEAVLMSPLPSLPGETSWDDSISTGSNPEAQSLEAEIRAAGYENLVAATGWLPELEIAYFQQKIPSEENPDFWGVEIGMSVPLWFWWGGRGEIQQARAKKRIAENELKAFEIEFASAWNQSVQNYRSAYEKNQIYEEELVPLAQETALLAQKSYSLGEATYLEVLKALRDYNELKLEHLESKVELYDQIIQMDKLSGQSILSTNNQ
jgi:cobalt-zinc-cadmium efflux system outer membrane protein